MKYDVVIIGAGVMGVAAAYELSQTGLNILLLEQFAIVNERNASQDYSRAFRYEYGTEYLYTNMAVESLLLWKDLERKSNKQLYFPCGMLLLGDSQDVYAFNSFQTLKKLGHEVDLLDKWSLQKRYPQFQAEYGVFDYHGGLLDARLCVDTYIDGAKNNGVVIREQTKVIDILANTIILSNGETISTDTTIITCGAWTNKLLKNTLPITITKQQLVYFKPKNHECFTKEKFPIFSYDDRGFYGFPMHGINAIKIAHHQQGEIVDLDETTYVSNKFIEDCREFFRTFIPSLADAEVVKTKVCLYDMTPDSNFIINKINKNIIVAGGFSGHGFKFAPLIGKMIANLVYEKEIHKDIPFDVSRTLSI